MTLSDAITQDQNGSRSDEGVLRISQSSCITVAPLSDYLVSYPGHTLEKSFPSAEIQSVYSTAPVDWETGHFLGKS